MSMNKFNPARSMLAVMLLAGLGMASMSPHAAPRFQPHEQMLMTDSLLPGGRVSISQFRDSGSVEDAMRRLEEDWESPDLPPMRSQRDGWQVMTHMDGDVIETVEMKRSGPGIEGRRIRWKPDEKAEAALAGQDALALLKAQPRALPSGSSSTPKSLSARVRSIALFVICCSPPSSQMSCGQERGPIGPRGYGLPGPDPKPRERGGLHGALARYGVLGPSGRHWSSGARGWWPGLAGPLVG